MEALQSENDTRIITKLLFQTSNIGGDIIEVGVFQGGSVYIINNF